MVAKLDRTMGLGTQRRSIDIARDNIARDVCTSAWIRNPYLYHRRIDDIHPIGLHRHLLCQLGRSSAFRRRRRLRRRGHRHNPVSLPRKYFGLCGFRRSPPCGMENMAKAMTKPFRDSSANVTYGETQVVISYVRTNWFWFSLPLSVWAMAAVLWTSTVIHTRRTNVSAWTNNILPLLFLYRGDVGKDEVGQRGTSNADYLRTTERIAVCWRFSDGKAKLE
jgi:hypothetical protein